MPPPDLQIPASAVRMGEIEGAPEGAPSDSREVKITFSSESPYRRHDWDRDETFHEVLGHTPDEVDLTRLNSGAAPLLKDHMPTLDSQIGVVVRAWLDGDRGHAIVRFSDTPAAEDVLARVRAGDVTCVSVGYAIVSAERGGADADGTLTVRVTRWVPKEISFVAIPADPSVGYGRNDGGDTPTITVTNPQEDMDMPNDTVTPEPNTPAPAVPAAPEGQRGDPQEAVRTALTADRERREAIEAIAARFDMPDAATRAALNGDTSVDAFREVVMDHIDSAETDATRAGATRIGLSETEVRSFSITNAMRYLMNPTDGNAKRAGFEIEASRAVEGTLGREAGGLFIPADVMMDPNFASRAQNTGTPAAGGALVAQDYRGGSFIELLRNRMALTGRGVRLLQGLQGNVDIPKQTGAGTFYWIDEDEDVTDTEGTYGVVSMTPHSAGMAIPFTRRMMQQASPDIEALSRDDLLKGLSIGLDATALVGHSSAKAPVSVRERLLATAMDWAGQYPTFEEIVGLETEVAVGNADTGDLAYIYDPRTSGSLKTTPRFTDGEIPIEVGGVVNGYPRVSTNQVAEAEVFFGNWSDLVIGMWGGIDLRVDTSTKAKSDGKVLRAFVDIDVAVRNIESFKMGKRA
ncbi:MAG: phage major capsid protein [Pseudomonadota bacterium]